jgi:hypothetical protein
MAHYLLSLLNQRTGSHEDPFAGFMDINPEDGRWGDYAFSQEGAIISKRETRCVFHCQPLYVTALDRIMSQLMENAGQGSRPAGLSEEEISKLERQVLEEGCAFRPFDNAHSV